VCAFVCVYLFGSAEKCHQQEVFLADLRLTFMFTDCVYVCVCVCVCVSFYFRQYQDFDTFVQLLRARAFSCCRSLILLRRMCVCLCVWERIVQCRK